MNEFNVNECRIPGYNLIYKNRSNDKRGGGVAILLDDCLQFTFRNDLSIIDSEGFESCFVELSRENLLLGEIYRVPNTPIERFF